MGELSDQWMSDGKTNIFGNVMQVRAQQGSCCGSTCVGMHAGPRQYSAKSSV